MGVIYAAKAVRASWRRARAACVVAGACGVLGAGCEVARPLNSFEGGPIPEPPELVMNDFGMPDKEDFGPPPGSSTGGATSGVTGTPTAGTTTIVGSTGGQTTGQTPSTSGDDGGAAPEDPLLKLIGDYYFRLDEVNVADGGTLLGRVTSTTETYGQIRVNVEEGVLVGRERLCHTETRQDADLAQTVGSRTDPAITGAIPSVRRVFSVTEGGWSTDVGRRRIGWEVGPQGDALPTDPVAQQAQIRDLEPEGVDGHDAPGFRVHVDVKMRVTERSCVFDMVSYSDTAYRDGTFDAAGGLGSATLQYGQSEAYAFNGIPAAECSTADIHDADKGTSTGELKLYRLDQALADFGACAPESEFAAALR